MIKNKHSESFNPFSKKKRGEQVARGNIIFTAAVNWITLRIRTRYLLLIDKYLRRELEEE